MPLSDLRAGKRELDPKTLHYLRDILRLGVGDSFVAFDAAAAVEATAVLLEDFGLGAHCTLSEPRTPSRIADSGITLIQALGKADKTEQVVRAATALGVAEIHLIESARSVARAGDRTDSKRARLESIALDAARQSLRGDVPQIAGPHSFEHEMKTYVERSALKVCLAPGAASSLRVQTRAWSLGEPIALMVGPEGGFAPEELARAERAGFIAARFGELVLRTELAGIAALGALLLLSEP
ncbi:MAG TPA: RsmE family RNA methyltransferase [Polyangiaceae bacterium]|nr:RsmE family RNA methyltransferase [Polyangiaceae bacterium]